MKSVCVAHQAPLQLQLWKGVPEPTAGNAAGATLWESIPHTQAILKLLFRYIVSILGLLSFAALLALVAWWFIATRMPFP